MSNLPFKRGDVYLIKLPLPDKIGHTLEKFAINLQEGKIIAQAPTFVCVIITTLKSSKSPKLYPTDLLLAPKESKTKFGAKVICNQIHTLHKSLIIDYKYHLSSETMRKIDERLLLGIGIIKIEDLLSGSK